MQKLLENKIAIITGAGSGIGAATAKLFAQQGAKVVVSDIAVANAEKIASEIKETGGEAMVVEADVSVFTQVENLVHQTIAKYGKLDILVNNAGIANKTMVKTAQHPLDEWDQVIAINQTGVFYCMKVALQQMLIQGGGNIVNIASLAGLKASGNNIAYSASKFAVVGMTKSAALEYGSKNIRINAVCPSYTHSALFNKVIDNKPGLDEKIKSFIPMNRFGEPEEIAEAILWLASDNTKYITGQTLTLDGGLSL